MRVLPLHDTSTFPSRSDERYICLATRYHEAQRGNDLPKRSQGAKRRPRDGACISQSPDSWPLHPARKQTRSQSSPKSIHLRGVGTLGKMVLGLCNIIPRRNTLVHHQHTLGSKMHTTENHQAMTQPSRRAAGITMARITETIHRGLKIHAGISAPESTPLVHKYSRTRAQGHRCWDVSNQLLPS